MTTRPKLLKRTALSLAITALAAGASMQDAWAAACLLPGATSWTLGANDDWTNNNAWSTLSAPNSTGTDACIVDGTSIVTLSTGQAVGNLQIGAGNGLSITTGNLFLGGSSLLNDGTLTNASYMELANNVTLSGIGMLTLAGGQIGTNSNGFTLTNQSTINGTGVIGSNAGPVYQNLAFANSGTVNANVSGSVLSIQGTGGTITNSGFLQATGGGILNLAPSGAIVNAGGTILADGGTVNISLGGGQMVQGGTLTSRNGGILQTAGAAGLDGSTQGAITLSSGSTYVAGLAGTGTQTFTTGTLNLASGSTLSLGGALELLGPTTLAGSGVVSMNSGQIGTNSNDFTLTNNVTIQGSGTIGSNGTTYQNLSLANSGLIDANLSGQTLSIQGTGGSISNTGMLRASNGGTLVLSTQAQLVNGGGTILATGAGSFVNLQNEYVIGGTLSTAAGGVMQTVGSVTLDGSTPANGPVTLSNGSTYNAGSPGTGTQTFVTGVLNLGTGGGGTLVLGGALELTGHTSINGAGGVVSMNSGQIGTNSNDFTLTNNVTIQGSGTIGSNGTTYQNLSLLNNALINANLNGQTLSIQGTGGSIVNAGTLRASNGGTLQINTQAALNNAAGTITADGNGSTVNLLNQTVQGGVLSTTNGGLMQTLGSAALDGIAAGAITLANGTTYTAGAAGTGTQTFVNGVLNLGTGNGATILLGGAMELYGSTRLNGSGGVVSMNSGQIGTNGNDFVLTNNVTIQGSGTIGSNGTTFQNLSLLNNALIDANLTGQTLSIQGTGGSIVNAGTLRASNGGTLTLNTQQALNNAAGSIVANGSGSTVNLLNQTVLGGMLTTVNGGVMQTQGSAALDGVTAGAVTLSDGSTYTAGVAATSTQTYVTGMLNLGTGGGATLALGGALELYGSTTLNGAGGIVSMNSGQIGTNGNDFTLTTNATIQGSGTIGSNGTTFQNLSLANAGLINANLNGQTLSIQGTGSSIVNSGTLQASNGGTLNLATQAPLNNAAGTLVAQGAGSIVNLSGQSLQGGTLSTFAGGVIQTAGSATLDGLTQGSILLSDGSTYTAPTGTLTNTLGTLNLGSSTGSTLALNGQMRLIGDTTIAGPGSITMTGGEIGTDGNGRTLNNQTLIQGQGLIGSNNGALFQNLQVNNSGTILANSAGNALTITGTGSLSGTGTLQVAGGGVLNLSLNGPSTQGQLVIGDSGSVLNLNSQSLTLTGDYTNAQSGSGNSFARRAGVTGTGLILAGGDVAQAITGSTVTGGDTASATLTVGNVRVGANTFGYALANTGTTGPTLRGAIQTSVNGASITDSRLSGSGVTAGNYSTGGPGSSSGQFDVVFTVGSAGPITPLTGQVLNFTSNFDNIGDQQLNIVVGSNAAAYLPAGGSTAAPVQVAAQRLNGTNTAPLRVSNTTSAGSYSEDLNAMVSGSSGPVSANGSVLGLLAGSSSNGAIQVAVDTTSAGVKSGTVTLAYQTAGTVNGVSNGLGVASVGTQQVAVSGKVYAPAVAQVNTGTIDFGIVHRGDTEMQAVSVTNAAATAALNDTLSATLGGASGPFFTNGSLNGLVAQGTNATSLQVGMIATTAGIFNSTATVTAASHDADIADLSLGSTSVNLKVQVNNYAQASFAQTSGAGSLSHVGNTYMLNLGALTAGGSALSSMLSVLNSATGPADLLGGSFTIASADPNFQLSGFGSFSGIGAGGSQGGLTVSFDGSTPGSFTETLVLHGIGSNASGYSGAIADTTLVLEGQISAAVPEPGTYLMMFSGLLAILQMVRRRTAARRI